jgi:hypothetical protein
MSAAKDAADDAVLAAIDAMLGLSVDDDGPPKQAVPAPTPAPYVVDLGRRTTRLDLAPRCVQASSRDPVSLFGVAGVVVRCPVGVGVDGAAAAVASAARLPPVVTFTDVMDGAALAAALGRRFASVGRDQTSSQRQHTGRARLAGCALIEFRIEQHCPLALVRARFDEGAKAFALVSRDVPGCVLLTMPRWFHPSLAVLPALMIPDDDDGRWARWIT